MQTDKPKVKVAFVSTGTDALISLEIVELREWSASAILEYMLAEEFRGEDVEEIEEALNIEIEGNRASFEYTCGEGGEIRTEYQMLLVE